MMALKFTRRTVVMGAGAASLASGVDLLAAPALVDLDVTDLRCDYQWEPLAVDRTRPTLSWRIDSPTRGVAQQSYRILVASTREALMRDDPDMWDSGRITSSRSASIAYEGRELRSRDVCYWRVLVWTSSGDAVRSAIAHWEMGLLAPSDWTADWLAAETQIARGDREAGLHWITGVASANPRRFRGELSLDRPTDGELTYVASGATTLWIDDRAIEVPALSPFAYGGTPAIRVPLRLGAGRHMFRAEVAPASAIAKNAATQAEFAALIRTNDGNGEATRITTRGWTTSTVDAPNWVPSVKGARTIQPWPAEPAMLFRREFTNAAPIARARLYVSALGGYRAELNGLRVGDSQLAPDTSDFRKRARYECFDVTRLLRTGRNCIGLHVGDGWYASNVVPGSRYAFGPGPRRVMAQLEVLRDDGKREIIGTQGDGWQMSSSPVLKSEIYDGEDYDARLEQPGWSTPSFGATSWLPARVAARPDCQLTALCSPPIRQQITLTAQKLSRPNAGVYVFDFGQNFAGWAKLRAKGERGRKVTLRFAELLLPDGRVDQSNLRTARASDTYILRGDAGGETYEPKFTYHGFRYVEVEGFPGEPSLADLLGIVVHSDVQETGRLQLAQPLMQRLWQNTLWSQRSNFIGVPTDCPQRDERLGWMGDAHVFWDAAAFNMDVAAFTRRYMEDVRDAQGTDGSFADYAPAAERLVLFEPGAAPGWADAGVMLPWTSWQRYGDTAIIDDNWEAMQRYIAFIRTRNPDFVWRNGRANDYGDWLALDAKKPGDPTTPKDLIGTAMWAHSLDCLIQMGEATSRKQDVAILRAEHAEVVRAFRSQFVRGGGEVGNGSQTGYILALRYGLLPESLRSGAAEKLSQDIRRRGTLLSTGFLGTPNSLDVLCDAGYVSLAYDLMLRTEFPSWGYMIEKGATTIWERWNGDTGDVSMNSFNHYALGAICGFMFRRIAGIEATEPGFASFRFAPVLDPRLNRGGADYDSVRGRIKTRWQQKPNGFELALTVPANVTAEVRLPGTATATLREGGQALPPRGPVRELSRDGRAIALHVVAGQYRFEVASS